MDFSLRRRKVKLSLVNFRVYLEPPIASQKVTKSPLLTYLPSNDMTTIRLWLTSCRKKVLQDVLKEVIAISFSAKGIVGN